MVKKRKNASNTLRKTRSGLYDAAKFLGDVNAVLSGDGSKLATRILRKKTGAKAQQGLGGIFKDIFK
jgi:hypothetical protein